MKRPKPYDNMPTFAKFINQKGRVGEGVCAYHFSVEYFQTHRKSCGDCHYIRKCIAWAVTKKDAPEWKENESRRTVF